MTTLGGPLTEGLVSLCHIAQIAHESKSGIIEVRVLFLVCVFKRSDDECDRHDKYKWKGEVEKGKLIRNVLRKDKLIC